MRRASDRPRVLPAATAVFALLVAGCDLARFSEPAAPAECAAIGARCQLPDGPIGVCLVGPCAAGATPPCFTCTPQH